MRIRRLLLLLFLMMACRSIQGMVISSMNVIHNNKDSDSSFYALCKVNANEIWAFGKNGVINSYDLLSGKLSPVDYPNTGANIYRAGVFPDGRVLAVGESGLLLWYYPKEKRWEKQQLDGFDNLCIYSLVIVSNNVAFATGGHNEIPRSKYVLPRGFLLATFDGGITWKTIRRFPTSMGWQLALSVSDSDILYFSLYRPPYTKVFTYSIPTSTIKTVGSYRGLFHDFWVDCNDLIVLCGSSGLNYRKSGKIASSEGTRFVAKENTGVIWDVFRFNDLWITSAYKGKLLVGKDLVNWEEMKLPVNVNFYAGIATGEERFIVAGQNQTLVEINLAPDNQKTVNTTE